MSQAILKRFISKYGHLKNEGLKIDGLIEIDFDRGINVISVSFPVEFDSQLLPEKFEGIVVRKHSGEINLNQHS